MKDRMWVQYCARKEGSKVNYTFHRFGNEPGFPAEGQLEYYQSFVLRLFYG